MSAAPTPAQIASHNMSNKSAFENQTNMIFPQGNKTPDYGTQPMSSRMNAHQVQDYIDLVIVKAPQLGEHYVARQLEWATAELDRVEGRA